ncbi:Spo0B domain-containing protein [Oceanobacillus arenosus]|nr:Spo0B domain-containing protein [Oceanobacillus arenosus]
MEEKEVVEVLQFYRHDIMNDLQIISGYVSMGKIEKVEQKFEELLSFYEEERKLMSLKAPKFILWIIRFNNLYDNFRLTYNIHLENTQLSMIDDILIKRSKKVMDFFSRITNLSTLYEVNLDLIKKRETSQIEVKFSIDGHVELANSETINSNLENEFHVYKRENRLESYFLIPID